MPSIAENKGIMVSPFPSFLFGGITAILTYLHKRSLVRGERVYVFAASPSLLGIVLVTVAHAFFFICCGRILSASRLYIRYAGNERGCYYCSNSVATWVSRRVANMNPVCWDERKRYYTGTATEPLRGGYNGWCPSYDG